MRHLLRWIHAGGTGNPDKRKSLLKPILRLKSGILQFLQGRDFRFPKGYRAPDPEEEGLRFFARRKNSGGAAVEFPGPYVVLAWVIRLDSHEREMARGV